MPPPCWRQVPNKGGGILTKGGILRWNTPRVFGFRMEFEGKGEGSGLQE